MGQSFKAWADLDMDLNEIQNATIQKFSADPLNPVVSQIWFNTTEKTYKTFDGSVIKSVGAIEFNVTATHIQWRKVGDAAWTNFYELPKLTYVQDFVNADNIFVQHNLGRFPSVTVVDTAHTQYVVRVEYINENSLRVIVNNPMSGKIFCN